MQFVCTLRLPILDNKNRKIMSDTRKAVAVFGLGNMGYEVARRIGAKFRLIASDRDQKAVQRACDELSATAFRPELLDHADAVVLCLPSPEVSMQVLSEIRGFLVPGSVVIETSTVNPRHIEQERDILAAHDVQVIDASILAGVGQMRAGTASLALGGPHETIARVQDVLDAVASRQIHFGKLGTGAAAKVINNAVAHAVMAVVVEAGALATATGVDHLKLVDVLSDKDMGLHRPLTYRYAERILQGDYEGGMPLDAARKDSMLVLQLAQHSGVPLFAIQGTHSVYDMAAAAGYGREDYAAIAKLWCDWGRPAAPARASRDGA